MCVCPWVCVIDFETLLECVANTANVVCLYETTQVFVQECVHIWCVLHMHVLIPWIGFSKRPY